MSQHLLGQRLVRNNIVTPTQLEDALTIQEKTGGKLGEILHSMGACNSLALHQEIAAQQSLPFADLLKHPPDTSLLDRDSLGEYLFLEVVPWKRDPKTGTVFLATPQADIQVRNWAKRHFPNHCFAITSRLDIHRSLARSFSNVFCQLSRDRLLQLFPDKSAQQTLMQQQRHWLNLMLALLFCAIWFSPGDSLMAILLIVTGFYVLTLAFKTVLFIRGTRYRHRLWRTSRNAPEIPDNECPVYSILIPLYDEVASLPQIIKSMTELNYPPNRLDIKLVIEADDFKTLAAAKALQPSGIFEIIEVPPSLPRTKPKACNYALRFARGEFLTIYDAEDKPDPQQLRRVLQRFYSSPRDTVCVQCRLNYYNRSHNLLTRLFAIEYAAWFDYMLPGLESLNLPIPLGGTSNHIALARLIELGEWDPYNVTEDADLGIRMAVAKYRTLTLYSLTREEAPVSLKAWLNQRSRWIKGYMQTWLVHMRHPLQLYQQLGGQAFWGFQFFIGGPCMVFLSTPFLLLIAIIWAWGDFNFSHPLLPLVAPISFFAFAYGGLLHLAFACQIAADTGWKNISAAIALFPFYWFLHSLASFKGLWQLITRPHYWEKTTHGVTPETKIPHSVLGSRSRVC